MHIKTIVSAGALAIALGFAGGATAQTMIGGQTISEGDLERVKVHCEDLQNRENAADSGSEDTESETTTPDTTTPETPDTTTPEVEGDEESTDEGMAGLVDLDEVTLQQCIDAGLITE